MDKVGLGNVELDKKTKQSQAFFNRFLLKFYDFVVYKFVNAVKEACRYFSFIFSLELKPNNQFPIPHFHYILYHHFYIKENLCKNYL